MVKNKILVIDDNQNMLFTLSNVLESYGFSAVTADNGLKAIEKIKYDNFKAVILDYKLPDENGDVILNKIRILKPKLPVIILTAYGDIKNAVESIKKGAYDYITKPFDNDEFIIVVKNAIEFSSKRLSEKGNSSGEYEIIDPDNVIFNNPVMQNIIKQIKTAAPTEMTILITGESGTGKEVVAKLIKNLSNRKNNPYITVDCGALTETLIESELFGHEKGSFTDAKFEKEGIFELANNGTIFLDEISNLSDSNQVKLLRAIEDRKITRVGGSIPIELNVRIISATNTDLSKAIVNNKFRSDLYYRLNEFQIKLPPLRERKEEIPLFIDLFIKSANKELKKKVKAVSDLILKKILEYNWPGNIRELRNNIRRAVLLNEGEIIDDIGHFEFFEEKIISENSKNSVYENSYAKSASNAERDIILNALITSKGNKAKTAKDLNMNIRTLYRKIKKLNINI